MRLSRDLGDGDFSEAAIWIPVVLILLIYESSLTLPESESIPPWNRMVGALGSMTAAGEVPS